MEEKFAGLLPPMLAWIFFQKGISDFTMRVIEIFLPLYSNEGKRFSGGTFRHIRDELTRKFGGITTYTRSPAHGLWKTNGKIQNDDIVIYEVMTSRLSVSWWKQFRKSLEKTFHQESIVVRISKVDII
jgi:hypothetical protein